MGGSEAVGTLILRGVGEGPNRWAGVGLRGADEGLGEKTGLAEGPGENDGLEEGPGENLGLGEELWGASVGGLAKGATVVTMVVASATGTGVVARRDRPLPRIFCLCWIRLFWKLRAGGNTSLSSPCLALLATRRCKLEMGSGVVGPALISSGALALMGSLSIRLSRGAVDASPPPVCFRPCRTFSQSLRLSLTCFLRLITRCFLGFQKFLFLALMLDLTRGRRPPAVLVGGQWKGLKHLPFSSSISLFKSAIVLNFIPLGVFCRMEPPVLDRGLSRKPPRGRCAPCDCCANSLALTRGLPEGLLPNRFLFLCRIGELEGL